MQAYLPYSNNMPFLHKNAFHYKSIISFLILCVSRPWRAFYDIIKVGISIIIHTFDSGEWT